MFQFIYPEILVEARQLSAGGVTLGLVLGIFLWLFGWWSHRFWVVLTTTVLAGIYGLHESSAFLAQPLLAGLLLALAAGLLALHLVRVLAFLAGGVAGLWAVQVIVPNLTQALICFLLSGILGLLLFRVWIMGLTSLAGTLLATYSFLSLLDRSGRFDAVEWATQGLTMLNWVCGILTLAGVALQYLLSRPAKKKDEGDKEAEPETSWDVLKSRAWSKFRKAG